MTKETSKKSAAWGSFAFNTTRGHMKSNTKALLAAAGMAAFAFSPANAYEAGYPGWATKPGVLIGASAGVPPPGIYMFDQVFTYQSNLVGPGTNTLGLGSHNGVAAAVDVQGFLFVPGWTFLGATYDALIVQPFIMASISNPIASLINPFLPANVAGMHNTALIPVELSWKLGTSGFAVKTGLTVYTPDGTIQGPFGLGNVGNPWWTFQPELIVSYLAGGYNLTAALYEEFNTRNSVDGYTTGDIFHADFTATKTFGKWTVGPVAYYVGQVTDDSCSNPCRAFLGPLGNAQRFNIWAAGGLVEYNFGPASLSVWATQEFSANARNAAVPIAADASLITRGATVFATLSYRLWAPEEPAKPAMFHK
ncbi:SphA family protein [Bradyrhizobium sp.]|uniref:SphA family protein n=1 Tax=Bradyrhizobium sp. TaxID=376 RepID=UPI003C63EDC8